MLACHELIQEVILVKKKKRGNGTVPLISSVPQSPIGVLDATCLSSKSGDDITVGSHANPLQHSPAAKKRKLSNPSVS